MQTTFSREPRSGASHWRFTIWQRHKGAWIVALWTNDRVTAENALMDLGLDLGLHSVMLVEGSKTPTH